MLFAGGERRVTAAEAFLLQLIKRGLDGDSAAARAAIAAIGDIRGADVSVDYWTRLESLLPLCPQKASTLRSSVFAFGTKLGRFRETARMMLEPWMVEAALARFAEKRPTPEQQGIVLQATLNTG